MRKFISLRAFISYAATFKARFWLTAAMFAMADILITAVPWFIGRLTASLTSADGNIVFWTAIVVLASIGHDILWRTSEILFLKLLLPRAYRIDDIIFSEIMQRDYNFFIGKFTGKISSYATMLGRQFREMLDEFHFNFVNIIVSVPVVVAIMFSVNVYTGLIFTVSLVLMFIIGRKLAAAMTKAESLKADKQSTMDGYAVDAIANFVSVKGFGNELREARRMYGERESLIEAADKAFFRGILFWGTMSLFVRWIIWGSTIILNVYLFSEGRIDLAQMTTFLTVIVLFSSFIWDLIWYVSQFSIKLASTEEAYRYLFGQRNIIKEPLDKATSAKLSGFDTSLELDSVSFAYPDKPDSNILRDVTLTIKKGERIGIVGPSGGGKSTLVKLLLGYYPILTGSLRIDGQPVDTKQLSAITAYVPQDTSIFHRSIRDNIAYATPQATEEDIVRAAQHAQADSFIRKLEQGYDTLVGERGIKLSGGQRQRVAIARAILKDAPLLILDEATSALDSESERLIQKALSELLEDRTALVIAHRLSTIQHLDRIVVFDEGRIVEQGSHDELLKKKGLYATLWSHQTDGFIR